MSGRKVILLGPLPPPFGGVSVFMDALVEHLRGTRLRVWALYGDRAAAGPETRFIKHRRLGTLTALISEGRGARIVDTTHFHLEYPNKVLLPPWLALKRLLGFEWIKYILDGSLPERHKRFGRTQLALFNPALRSADAFIVVHEDLRRWLVEELKVTQPVKVIPCLLPLTERDARAALSDSLRAAVSSYLSHARRVCSIGVFIESYGFADVADAVERLRRESGEDIGLILLDGTFARDEVYRERVLSGREWITVVENVPNRQVYRILDESHAFVRAFGQESYGISRIEAMWCGLPVVATRRGETRGMLLYDFGDVDELASQLRRALFDAPAHDAASWAETFRREAEGNLGSLKKILELE